MASFERIEAFAWELEQAEIQHYRNRGWAQDKFYASSYVDCGRQQVFKINNPDEAAANEANNMVLQYKREAALGDFIHGTIQSWAVATGKVDILPDFQRDPVARNVARKAGKTMPAIEVPISSYTIAPDKYKIWKQVRLGGKVDGILVSSAGDKYVWEIKTVADRNLTPPGDKYLEDKLAHYEAQTQIYMWALGIPRGLILVVNRERFMDRFMGRIDWPWSEIYLEYLVEYNEQFIEREFARLEELGRFIVPPPVDPAVKKNSIEFVLPDGEKHRGPCSFCIAPCIYNKRLNNAKVEA